MAIISQSLGLIFVKTHKTAGTSMEVHIEEQCGPGDIITNIFPKPEFSNHTPRNNYQGSHEIFYNHMPASKIRSLIGDKEFNLAFRFCFERHPVDKCLSYFAMLLNSPAHINPENPSTWQEYVEAGNFPTDHDLYLDESGKLMVDRLFRYEDISGALKVISSETRLEYRPLTAREKTGFRHGVPSFEEVTRNSSEKNRIMDAFAPTLEFVDYR